jgi:predicted phosphodiesterase
MRFQLASDLHLEFHADRGVGFLSQTKAVADTLVLAGDILPLRFFSLAKKDLSVFCKRWRMVFFVSGNHEYYRFSPSEGDAVLASIEKAIPNFKVLRPGRIEVVEGKRILGATLWFQDDYLNNQYADMMNDFDCIQDFVPWVYRQNQEAMAFLKKEVQEGDIVVTHHLPTMKSVDPWYERSSLNRFFVCEMDETIHLNKPAVWAHGHTHHSRDYKLADTRIVCNALGYPGEPSNGGFQDEMVIEVP